MSSNDDLGDRMKRSESVPSNRLMRRVPVILRADGKAFSTFSSSLEKPVDSRMQACMWAAAKYMCQEMQGAKLAYVQSDEISVVMTDYATHTSEAWFDYQVQKMVSVGAALATVAFNKAMQVYMPDCNKMPVFDARVYNVPLHEVANYFLWRQQDATRNSISSLAQANFSHTRLHGVDTGGMQEMLFTEKNINWNDCPTSQKRGVCIKKVQKTILAMNPKTGVSTDAIRSS